jgi:hypothetical protein
METNPSFPKDMVRKAERQQKFRVDRLKANKAKESREQI